MIDKLSQRDKRALKIGAIAVVAVLGYVFVISGWLEDWRLTRSLLATQRARLASIMPGGDTSSAAKQAGLFSVVPKFEMPQAEKIQRPLFREKFNEQLTKAGIKVKSLKYIRKKAGNKSGAYQLLPLECRGKCKFEQALGLLASLNENPYFVGAEDVQLKFSNTKERKEMDLVLVVSTFAK